MHEKIKNKKLVIVGDSAFAEIAHEYFDYDSEYEVVGFSVEREFMRTDMFRGVPVTPFEEIQSKYDPRFHEVYVAISYGKLNRIRTRLAAAAKDKGYKLASYISTHAYVWRNVSMGEHCFIFEDNTVQPFVSIENNVVMWSGNHIGHHSTIRNNCFITSHACIAGFCDIGESSFLGVNTTVANNITVGRDNWIGPNVSISKNTADGLLFKSFQPKPSPVSTMRFFKINDV